MTQLQLHPSVVANLGLPVPVGLEKQVIGITSRARTKMTVLVPFFGHLLLKLQPTVTRKVPLAGVTPDRKLLINPDWATTTTLAEFAATLVHEVLHAALLYWARKGSREALAVGRDGSRMPLWNIAHDYAINLIIRDMIKHTREVLDPAHWQPAGLLDEKYRNWSAEEIYDDLLMQAQQNGQGGSAGGPETGAGVYIFEVDATKDDAQEGTGSGEGAGEGQLLSQAEQKASDQFWKVSLLEAVQVQEKSANAGKLPHSIRKYIDELLDPRVSWLDVLSRWVGENGRRADFSYRRPSRRSSAIGELLPSMVRHGVSDIVVLWDTSGSMCGREQEIMSEVIGICQDLNMSLRVICCDAAVHSDQDDVTDAEDIDIAGGGGSNFCPAFTLLDEEGYEGVVIAFTDGYINVPETKPQHLRDCLWVIWASDADPTGGRWGEVVYIDDEGYAK